jgi:hypothetical protein
MDQHNLSDDFIALLSPLVQRLVTEEVAKRLAAIPTQTKPTEQPQVAPGLAVLNFTQVHSRYGIGRMEWNRLINSGELKATPRRMKGGHMGYVVSVQEAARVLGAYSING